MSDEREDLTNDTPDAEFPADDEAITVEQPAPSRMPLALALLSLALAAVALAATGWLLLTRTPATEPVVQDTSAVDELSATVSAAQASIATLQSRLETLANRDVASSRELADIQKEFEQRLGGYESLPGRMDNVEDALSSIQGISTGVRDTWLLAEAEYYMQIANAQLQLAGNPELARLALMQADERIQQLANPALTNVRRALATELRALSLISRPDIEGITLTLASLADSVVSLPLSQDIVPGEAEDADPAEELSGVDRAVESLKSTMRGVVSVRRTDENVRPLIAPESAYFLRANLSLQLQAARLALLRSEKAVFQQSLDDAASWLVEYYDTDSSQVQAARSTIVDIRDALFDVAIPDISESLRLLRQFNTLAASQERAAATAAASRAATPPAEPAEEPVDGALDEASDQASDQASDEALEDEPRQ